MCGSVSVLLNVLSKYSSIHLHKLIPQRLPIYLSVVGSVGNSAVCLFGLRSNCRNYAAQVYCPALSRALI